MELREIERLPGISELIDDPRYGYSMPTRDERWLAHIRVSSQATECMGCFRKTNGRCLHCHGGLCPDCRSGHVCQGRDSA